MRASTVVALALLALAAATALAPGEEPASPIPDSEQLMYTIAWPSGLPVGRASLRARTLDPGWRFEMTLRATLPSIEIDDVFVTRTDSDLCSEVFEKHVRHGERRAHESLRFGPGLVERFNLEAPAQEAPGRTASGDCARDALAFLYYLRQDLAAGRIPSAGSIFFGAAYRIRLRFVRPRRLTMGEDSRLADEFRAVVEGPASRHEFSVFMGQDEARKPLLFRMEFDEGTFSMQLDE